MRCVGCEECGVVWDELSEVCEVWDVRCVVLTVPVGQKRKTPGRSR